MKTTNNPSSLLLNIALLLVPLCSKAQPARYQSDSTQVARTDTIPHTSRGLTGFTIKRLTPQIGFLTQRSASTGISTDGFSAGVVYSSGIFGYHWGPGIGIEYLSNRGVVAPKLWFEAEVMIFTARLDCGYYEYRKRSDLRLTPQLGVSLLGFLNAYYGYQVPVNQQELSFLSRHRFTFTLNLLRPK
jgi:hypothetical protein